MEVIIECSKVSNVLQPFKISTGQTRRRGLEEGALLCGSSCGNEAGELTVADLSAMRREGAAATDLIDIMVLICMCVVCL